jgi:hypothetical protein
VVGQLGQLKLQCSSKADDGVDGPLDPPATAGPDSTQQQQELLLLLLLLVVVVVVVPVQHLTGGPAAVSGCWLHCSLFAADPAVPAGPLRPSLALLTWRC